MLHLQNLMRRGLKVFRMNATAGACSNLASPPLPLALQHRARGQRNVSTGDMTGRRAAQNFQAETFYREENHTKIASISQRSGDWMLEVKWDNGRRECYPYIWLRDNCQYEQCFHPTAHARTVDIKDLDVSIVPTSVNVIENSSAFEITWPDGHLSAYNSDWLRERSFAREGRRKRQQIRRGDRELWDANLLHKLPTAKYEELLSEDSALLDFIVTLEKIGLVIVSGAPTRVGGLLELTKHLGYWNWSHYGPTFSVKTRVDPINLAYTSGDLLLHTDLACLQTKPEIQLLHCIEQASCRGGENVLVDSFNVAEQLRDRYPEKFELLSTTPIDFIDVGNETKLKRFFELSKHPLIEVDRDGEICAVSSSHMARDSHFNAPLERVRNWYAAMLTFYDLLYLPENTITYKMKDGDILIFDNSRIMHGRIPKERIPLDGGQQRARGVLLGLGYGHILPESPAGEAWFDQALTTTIVTTAHKDKLNPPMASIYTLLNYVGASRGLLKLQIDCH
ncbi:gamma-butyrobetaine dioxygenase-like isoform X2 [Macrobrachium nipponense]